MKEIKIDEIIRSKRKTFSLEIKSNGSLIVRVPKRASIKTIQEIVNKKRSWIIKKQKAVKGRHKKRETKKFVEGEQFFYLGKPYKLCIIDITDKPLYFNDKCFLLSGNYAEYGKEIFIRWYKIQAYSIISERVKYYSSVTGLKYRKIRITNAQRRWGSCSPKNNINFPWRLVMTPPEIIDYVVVHELAHIAEKNHSRKFWKKVENILPDYKKRKTWLREHNHLFTLD